MAVYQTYINAMNDKIRKAININNPFVFKHISNLKVRVRAGEDTGKTRYPNGNPYPTPSF